MMGTRGPLLESCGGKKDIAIMEVLMFFIIFYFLCYFLLLFMYFVLHTYNSGFIFACC